MEKRKEIWDREGGRDINTAEWFQLGGFSMNSWKLDQNSSLLIVLTLSPHSIWPNSILFTINEKDMGKE